MRPSNALFVALLFAARPLVVQAQSSKFTPPEVMLRDAKHKEPKSGVQIGPGNTITIQSGVGTPTTINVLSLERMGLCSPLARISVELLSGMLPIRSSCVLLKQDRELFTLSPSLPMDKP